MVLTIEPSDIHDAYTSVFTIYRMTQTPGTGGKIPKTWNAIETNVPGRATHKLNRERFVNDLRKERLSQSFYCDPWVDVKRGDVVVVTNAPSNGVKALLVEHADIPANLNSHVEIIGKAFDIGGKEVPGFRIPGVGDNGGL